MVRHTFALVGRTLTACRMIKVSEQYSLEDLCAMTEEDMEALLGFYKPNTVPSLDALRLQEEGGAFDGPFLI
jgi:precorrin-2 dehydrogenase/sirohydrochlorin ferrochelatase